MRYEINDIERLTGIKAHTLRIWEKRYNLVEPYRTGTNIRYYDDAQVKKLMNVCTLVNAGKKISKVAKMSERDVEAEVYLLQISGSEQDASAALVTQLTIAMLEFDQHAFEAQLDRVVARYGIQNGISSVIYPFLENVGILWSTNEAMPAQEHFASCLIRKKLIVETARLPEPRDGSKPVMLFLPPNEYHEIGLLLAHCVLKSMGISTIYLGAAVPFENVLKTFEYLKPGSLVSFFILHKKKMDLPDEFGKLARKTGGVPLLICGRPEMTAQLPQLKNIVVCNTIDSFRAAFSGK
jgi:DNA-binding transcriptional MerR regulator